MDQEDRIYSSQRKIYITMVAMATLYTVLKVMIQLKVKVWPSQIMTLRSSKNIKSKTIFLIFFYLWSTPKWDFCLKKNKIICEQISVRIVTFILGNEIPIDILQKVGGKKVSPSRRLKKNTHTPVINSQAAVFWSP